MNVQENAELKKCLDSKNIMVIAGEVNGEMVSHVMKTISLFFTKGSPDITILIDSPGGDVYAGLDIYDFLKLYPGKKTAIVFRRAASMAAVILQACEERYVTAHAAITIHHISQKNVSLDLMRNHKEVREIRLDMEKKQAMLYSILVSRTGKSTKQVRDECKKDRMLFPEEAIKFGLIDGIWNKPLPK